MTKTNTLYQVKDTDRFGTYLATNSKGQWVLEMKDTSKPEVFDPSNVEEVLPYTVGVKFLTNTNNTTYHYTSKEGEVNKGDIVFVDRTSGFARVTGVDTKSKSATKPLTGFKVPVVAIGE